MRIKKRTNNQQNCEKRFIKPKFYLLNKKKLV